MSHNIETAKALIQQGFAIIPLKKYQKHNTDKNILERRYTVEDILNPIDIKVKLKFFDNVVSPPHNLISYFFCSSAKESEIFFKFFFEKLFLFPAPEMK